MIKLLINTFIILLSHICHSHPTITEYYDINEVNKLSFLELERARFDLSLQSHLQITEYGFFDFSHPFNGRAVRIAGILLPRDIEVYLRILSSPVLHNPPYNVSLGHDERLLRHLGFVKGVVKLSKSGIAYTLIKKILKNQVSSLTNIKDIYKPDQTWPTYLDNRAAYTNLWKHATNLFSVKIDGTNKVYYYFMDGEVRVFKYRISFDAEKFQDLAILLGYWNFDKITIPDYLIREFERELNDVNRSDYPKVFFGRIEELGAELNKNKLYNRFYNESYKENQQSANDYDTEDDFFNPGDDIDILDLDDLNSFDFDSTSFFHFNAQNVSPNTNSTQNNLYNYQNNTANRLFKTLDTRNSVNTRKSFRNPKYHLKEDTQNEIDEYITKINLVEWKGGLTWEQAMLVESRRVARVLIKILYKATRAMMKSHNIDVSTIQRDRIKLYKTTLYSKPIKALRNRVNNSKLLLNIYDGILLDDEAEEILFESGSKYKSYWNLKNDLLYNKRTISDRSIELDQSLIDHLLFEPNKFYNKLINISGDGIDFKRLYHILLALTQETTPYYPKFPFSQKYKPTFSRSKFHSFRYLYNQNNKPTSKRVTNFVDKVVEQYKTLPPSTNSLLRGRAKCLMAFLYLFGVPDTKGNLDFPYGWPRNIKKSMNLLINGIASPCGLCNTLLGFLASIGFPPISNNMFAWETRKNEEETTVYQLISGNLFNSFLRRNPDLVYDQETGEHSSDGDKTLKSGGDPGAEDKESKELPKNKGKSWKNWKVGGNKKQKSKEDSNLLESEGVIDRSGYDLPLLCYLSGSYKNDELSSLAYSYYIHSGIGNPSRTCQKSAQSSINRSPKNVGMMCLDALPYAIESARSSIKNKHDQNHEASEEYKSKRYAEFIKKLSHMGDSDGLRMMGDFYYTGHEEGGIRRNYQQAINFWSRAAESGDPSSALAIAHHHLTNMQTDDSGYSALQAERYLRMVLNSSSPTASAFSTANFYLYRHGLGHPRDSAMAARYLRESADRGDVNSMVLMGHAYAGILTDVTPPEGRNIFMSFYYYRRAAQSGNSVGLFNSAVFTLHGYDLEYTNALDRCNEAYKLFSRVARMGTMSTLLKVLSKRAKSYNDKIGHILMNMLMSELGDSNAHRELSKHFKSNSLFCYTENLDPDITPPTTLFTSKNTSNSKNPITFKNFQNIQTLLKKPVLMNSFEYQAETRPHDSTLGNMGANTNLGSFGNSTTRITHQDRNEAHRMSREIRMLNMVRVTEMPEDPEPDLRTRGLWNRDESQNVSIFESLNNSTNLHKDKREYMKVKEGDKVEEVQEQVEAEGSEESSEEKHVGSCYYYYSRRGAYSPQNSTPLLLAEALLSGKPWLPSEALFWAKRSKESESLKGSYMYATMMEAGLGAPKNCQASFKIFKEFMASKSRGERILGLVCILRNKIISKFRHPHFLYTLLVRFLYDSYAYNSIVSKGYTPCDYAFFNFDRIPPSGLRFLSSVYFVIVAFTFYVYFKITSH